MVPPLWDVIQSRRLLPLYLRVLSGVVVRNFLNLRPHYCSRHYQKPQVLLLRVLLLLQPVAARR